MPDQDRKAALVTGAASGIGAAVARELHGLGARVACADIDLAGARATAGALDGSIAGALDGSIAGALDGSIAVALDVREEASWAAAIEATRSAFGPLGVLVNCVGVSAASPLAETTLREWRRVLATNLDGAFLGTKHAMLAMKEGGGAIVHVGSASGIRAAAGAAAYSTSKAALRMLVRSAAKECREAGLAIRVNLVSPAGVKTPMWRTMTFFQDLIRATGSEEAAFASMAASGGGRFLDPEEVARAVSFLVSDAAAHVTGVELPVDDGWVL